MFTAYRQGEKYADKGLKLPTQKGWSEYERKLPDGEALVLEILVVRSTPPLLLLPGPAWPGVVVPIRVPSLGSIYLLKIINIGWEYMILYNSKLSVPRIVTWCYKCLQNINIIRYLKPSMYK